jgi:hypothetical protein
MSAKHTGGYWFEDPRDPRVARWFDGRRPTDHTIRIADLEEGVAPPEPLPSVPVEPPRSSPGLRPTPKHAARPRPAPSSAGEPIPDFLWGADRPWWTVLRLRLIVGACASVLVVTAAIGLHVLQPRSADGGGEPLRSQTVGSQSPFDAAQLDAAVTHALGSGASGLTADGLQDLLPLTCKAIEGKTPTQLAGRLSMYRFTTLELGTLVRALKVGSRDLCEDAARAYQAFFDDVLPMVLVANPSTDAVQLSGDATSTGGYANTGGTIVTGSATATGSVSTRSGSSSVQVSNGSSCSVPGASSTVSGGTALCTSVSCQSTGTNPTWRSASC